MDRGHRVNVLDHGFVEYVDSMGDDDRVMAAAQESTNYAKRTSNVRRLLTYLMKHGHTSPFEQVEFQIRIKAPLVPVLYQIVRHRTAHINQVSGRYGEFPDEFYIPDESDVRVQHATNKQMIGDRIDPFTSVEFVTRLAAWQMTGYQHYQWALEHGVARETARYFIAPTIYSEIMWKIDMHNLMSFLAKRQHESAQLETRMYADAIYPIMRHVAPFTTALFDNPHVRRVYRHAVPDDIDITP